MSAGTPPYPVARLVLYVLSAILLIIIGFIAGNTFPVASPLDDQMMRQATKIVQDTTVSDGVRITWLKIDYGAMDVSGERIEYTERGTTQTIIESRHIRRFTFQNDSLFVYLDQREYSSLLSSVHDASRHVSYPVVVKVTE